MNYLGSLVSLVRVMSWSMNWPHTTSSTVTAWSWNPSSYNNIHTSSKMRKKVSNLVHVSRDSAWSGKRSTGDGTARSRDPVGVIRGQEPCNANLTLFSQLTCLSAATVLAGKGPLFMSHLW